VTLTDQGRLPAKRFSHVSIVIATIILAASAIGAVAAAPDTTVQPDNTTESVGESVPNTTDNLTEATDSTTPSQETEPAPAKSAETSDTKSAEIRTTQTETSDTKSAEIRTTQTEVCFGRTCPDANVYFYRKCTTCFGGGPIVYVLWYAELQEDSHLIEGGQAIGVSPEWEVVAVTGEYTFTDIYNNYNTLEYKVRYDNTTETGENEADEDSRAWVKDEFYFFVISSDTLPKWGETGVYCDEANCDWYVIGIPVVNTPTPHDCADPAGISEAPSQCEVFDPDNPQVSPSDPPDNPSPYYYIFRLEQYGDYGLAYWAQFGVWTDKSDSDQPRINSEIGGVYKPSELYTTSRNDVYLYDGRNRYGVSFMEDTDSNSARAGAKIYYAGYSQSMSEKAP